MQTVHFKAAFIHDISIAPLQVLYYSEVLCDCCLKKYEMAKI